MKFHFDCIFYYVSDLERSIRFYQDVLGFKLVSLDAVCALRHRWRFVRSCPGF